MTVEFCDACGCSPCDCDWGLYESEEMEKTKDEHIQTGRESEDRSSDGLRQTQRKDALRKWADEQYSCSTGHGCGRIYSIHYKEQRS